MRLEPGTPIDVWCVEQRLGSGGMGAVYRCFNRSAPRIRAALKILDPTLAYDPEIRGRFIREAELLFQLDHPNIVKVRNINMDASPPFIEMAFCQGRPLDAMLSDGRLPLGVAALVGAQLAEALAHVHDRGIRHRDVKPGNIIVNGDHVTLVDFGIATEGAARTMNMSGGALGTVAYAPPEWGGRQSTDPMLWDAYSLGQVIWECLSGRPAFAMPAKMDMREGIFHLLTLKRATGALDPGEGVPDDLRELVRTMTLPDPNLRLRDLREAAVVLWRHAEKGTGFLPEVEPLGVPSVMVHDDSMSGHSDTMFFPDLESEDMGQGAKPPNLAAWSEEDASPHADTIADASLTPSPVATTSRLAKASFVGLGVAAVLGLAGFLFLDFGPTESSTVASASPRPIQLTLKGDKPDLPVQTLVDGKPTTMGQSLLPGPHTFEVVVGVGCEPVDGVRPSQCGVTTTEKRVSEGTGIYPISLNYPTFVPSEVSLQISGASADKVRVDDGDWTGIKGSSWTVSDLDPGAHTLVVRGGRCPDEVPCADGCPKTCSEASAELFVPFHGGSPIVAEVALPKREEVKKTSRSRGRVTRRQFADWVKSNPRYAPEQMRGTRTADKNYVKGWSIDRPGGGAADQVPPAIAATYCGRKGLAPVSAAPTSWPEGAISYEIRAGSNGQPVLLHFSGAVSKARASQSTPTVGFRCR